MATTAAQICALAMQDAKAPGFTEQAGVFLNMVLQELAQTYDFDTARGVVFFNFDTALSYSANPNIINGSAYDLPDDYLRADYGDVFWTLQGVPYPLISYDLYQFDMMVQQAGLQSYPYAYATDMSQSPPVMYVYPPPSGDYPVTIRYRRQMPDIVDPANSSTVPWFPFTQYLRTRVAAELMGITDDSRRETWLAESKDLLTHYLKLKDDKSTRTATVKLDRRFFGNEFNRLPNTKKIGW
jgi:hypothetical protein